MKERIKELRKSLQLSRDDFGKSLGVSRDVIANIELDRLARPDQKEPLLRLICEKYNVSYIWLTTGQGDMRDFSAEDFIKQLASKFGLDETDKEIISTYLNTPLPYRNFCKDALALIVNGNYETYLKDQKKPPSKRLDYLINGEPSKAKPRPGGDRIVETVVFDDDQKKLVKEKKQDSKESVNLFQAASSKSNAPPEIIKDDTGKVSSLKKIPKVTGGDDL